MAQSKTIQKRAELARGLGFIHSSEYRTLAGINEKTEIAHRKRGKSPQYVRLGNEFYYVHESVGERMRANVHVRKADKRNPLT